MSISVEIVNTGSELMLGRVLNTHQQWLCDQLSSLGYQVDRQVAINDDAVSITNAVAEALAHADIVIVTGGLGPTSDDITRAKVANLLHRRLLMDEGTLVRLKDFFAKRNRIMPEGFDVQAQYPEGGHVIPNDYGTAPGLEIELSENPFRKNADGQPARGLLILLPGPPRELLPMFTDRVITILKRVFPLQEAVVCETLRTACTGESVIEGAVAKPLQKLVERGLEIGYCARVGEVELRFRAKGTQAQAVVDQAKGIAISALGNIIYGRGTERLEAVLVRLLKQHNKTVGTVESCTGGFIAHRITNVPGASAVLMGSCVTYSNDAKMELVGVQKSSLDQHGAVSEEVACEMAAGLRKRLGLDYALSATGIAGPDGGTPEKPVGTVYIGLASGQGVQAKRFYCPYDRESFKLAVSQYAMDWLRKELLPKDV